MCALLNVDPIDASEGRESLNHPRCLKRQQETPLMLILHLVWVSAWAFPGGLSGFYLRPAARVSFMHKDFCGSLVAVFQNAFRLLVDDYDLNSKARSLRIAGGGVSITVPYAELKRNPQNVAENVKFAFVNCSTVFPITAWWRRNHWLWLSEAFHFVFPINEVLYLFIAGRDWSGWRVHKAPDCRTKDLLVKFVHICSWL